MAHEEDNGAEQSSEHWLNSFEEECLEELDAEPNMAETLQAQREYATQKLFFHFQNSATSIAQLYKDRQSGLSLFIPFQNAAASVTSLYKDSVDSLRRCVDVGVQRGRQHRTKDIVAWAKKRRRHIRREDLLAFLCGKSPPSRNRLSGPIVRHTSASRLTGLERSHSPRVSGAEACEPAPEPDLQAFREAIALQGLNGAMSNISVDYNRPHGTPSAQLPRNNNMEELNRFIMDEISQNYDSSRKRTSSPDVLMDSPSRKRSRYSWRD
ncbi:HUWE1-associated protein modifying stress responses-like [Argopecten irradians]|uniref:HUWE1-associated protein modifying stress responses-like n=1 Tax=Argopecten irradians TaxID=31199 RepID=UPI00371D789E